MLRLEKKIISENLQVVYYILCQLFAVPRIYLILQAGRLLALVLIQLYELSHGEIE
jgi:hypothetical protein